MPQQTQQAPDPRDRPDEELSIAEMTRLMDVAAVVRKERLTAEQQLDIHQTKRLLRERLLESARVSGDPVTEEEIDAAIDAYYDRLHEFTPPEPGVETFLASLYVRRGTLVKLAIALATIGVLWWSVFAFGLVGEKRQQRALDSLLTTVTASADRVEQLAADPDLKTAVEKLRAQADTARQSGDRAALEELRQRLDRQAGRLALEYTLTIVSEPGKRTGVTREFTDDNGTRISGFYLIVRAQTPDGQAVRVTIRDAETDKTVKRSTWGEQVPEAVFNRIESDKQADGVVDENVFAKKQRGYMEPAVEMTGAGGEPIARGRQITRW